MTQLSYRCPHCRERVEVESEKVGGVNVCSACEKPYQPEVPVARLMHQREDGEWAVASDAVTTGQRAPGEATVKTVHPAMFRARPIKYLLMIGAIIIGLVGLICFGVPIGGIGIDTWWRPITLVISIMFGVFALASVISLIHWFFDTRFQSLTITNERTIWTRGIFDRETSEVQHDDVRNIQVKQTFMDRILGVGRIAISSAGQDEMEIDVRDVPKPDKVAGTVRGYQARMQGHGGD